MSNLTFIEKEKFERLLGMGSGYVLGGNFSNRTFQEFIHDSTGRDIYDSHYSGNNSGSKANQLRGFWKVESNAVVAKLMSDLLDYGNSFNAFEGQAALAEGCKKVIMRLRQDSSVHEAEVLTALSDEHDFEIIVKAVRDAIDKNELELGLDRLHTFIVKFVRSLCERRGIAIDREKPLHSLFGEYVRSLKGTGYIDSQMTERILKSSISVLEAFNDVRNTKSLAHDNQLLNYDEALLIFNYVASSVRFLLSLRCRIEKSEQQKARAASIALEENEEIPF